LTRIDLCGAQGTNLSGLQLIVSLLDPETGDRTGGLPLTSIGDTTNCDKNYLSLPKNEYVSSIVVFYNAQSIVAIYFYTNQGQIFAKGRTGSAIAKQEIKLSGD
jgi:hypothetical protein